MCTHLTTGDAHKTLTHAIYSENVLQVLTSGHSRTHIFSHNIHTLQLDTYPHTHTHMPTHTYN